MGGAVMNRMKGLGEHSRHGGPGGEPGRHVALPKTAYWNVIPPFSTTVVGYTPETTWVRLVPATLPPTAGSTEAPLVPWNEILATV